jgi:hypothetical protein
LKYTKKGFFMGNTYKYLVLITFLTSSFIIIQAAAPSAAASSSYPSVQASGTIQYPSEKRPIIPYRNREGVFVLRTYSPTTTQHYIDTEECPVSFEQFKPGEYIWLYPCGTPLKDTTWSNNTQLSCPVCRQFTGRQKRIKVPNIGGIKSDEEVELELKELEPDFRQYLNRNIETRFEYVNGNDDEKSEIYDKYITKTTAAHVGSSVPSDAPITPPSPPPYEEAAAAAPVAAPTQTASQAQAEALRDLDPEFRSYLEARPATLDNYLRSDLGLKPYFYDEFITYKKYKKEEENEAAKIRVALKGLDPAFIKYLRANETILKRYVRGNKDTRQIIFTTYKRATYYH